MIFIEPGSYKENDHFFFNVNDNLEQVCNAPKDKNGIYKVIELRNGRISVAYLGFSKNSSLFNEIVNGLHIDGKPRKKSWGNQIDKDNTDALDIYWYVTPPKLDTEFIRKNMLMEFLEHMDTIPKWNI